MAKVGSGTLTLTGTANCTGGTTIDGGNLEFGSAAAIPGGSGSITIYQGGALNVSGAYNTVERWLASDFIDTVNSTGALALTGGGPLTVDMTGGGNLSLGATAGSDCTVAHLTPADDAY